MATLHWSSANSENHNTIYVDMTQWHTWGVIWTPTSVTYTLDGRVWAQVANSSEVPHQPMTLDIQQQTWCDVATNAVSPSNCPTVPESTLVDWVAEYQSNGSTPPALTAPLTSQVATSITVKSFAAKSAALTPTLKSQISKLARQISASSANKVVLTGYSDDVASAAASLSISRSRALIVSLFLRGVLESWHVSGVTVSVSGAGSSKPVASNSTPAGRAQNRRVVAVIS
jgi:outer membrane protein OmpA-like peptidoglycan-associated protein